MKVPVEKFSEESDLACLNIAFKSWYTLIDSSTVYATQIVIQLATSQNFNQTSVYTIVIQDRTKMLRSSSVVHEAPRVEREGMPRGGSYMRVYLEQLEHIRGLPRGSSR
jgi:hypothetical protein